jgi:hypothetical protein
MGLNLVVEVEQVQGALTVPKFCIGTNSLAFKLITTRFRPWERPRRAPWESSILIKEILQFAHRFIEANVPAKGAHQFRWTSKRIVW